MQAYKAHYRNGHIIPEGNPIIQEGSEIIIVIKQPNNNAKIQQEAFKQFMYAMENTPELPCEFDDIISKRVNINRDIIL